MNLYINEVGVYKQICCSSVAACQAFSDYVSSGVLFSIRKHGYYIADKVACDKVYKHPRGGKSLHYRIVNRINETDPDVIIIPRLSGHQTMSYMRLDSKKIATKQDNRALRRIQETDFNRLLL